MIPEDILFNLPELLKNPRAVLWDEQKRNLLYVLDVPGNPLEKYVIEVDIDVTPDDGEGSTLPRGNYVRSGERVPLINLKDQPHLELVDGEL